VRALDSIKYKTRRALNRLTHPPTGIAQLVDLPYPLFSLDDDQIEPILSSREYADCVEFFTKSPARVRALVSPNSQALLYVLVRGLRPQCVVEIGTYRASTTEALARAAHANKAGVVHTVDPFGEEFVPQLLRAWPKILRDYVRFHPVNSMQFFARAAREHLRSELIFIDGNHDFEFALFDIQSAARVLAPKGLIVVDNIAQPGPFFAVHDFLSRNPDWRQLGRLLPGLRDSVPYDRHRTGIVNTDFAILLAPPWILVGPRPITSGYVHYTSNSLRGLRLKVIERATGTLSIQIILRSFGAILSETILERKMELIESAGVVEATLDQPFEWTASPTNTAEPWLDWRGDRPLKLAEAPILF
jgi:predicted O-methyltransferase YrrM